MEYPSPTPSQLGQSQSGYSDQHSEEYILPKDRTGRRVVYGQHQGLAIADPVKWQQHFKKWFAGSPPSNEPLHPNEKTFCENHGIIFTHKLGDGGYGSVWGCTVTQRLSDVPQRDYTTYKLACKVLSLRIFYNKDKLRS